MSGAWFFWGILFGVIDLGFFVVGRKTRSSVPLVCGLCLMVFPYFVSNIFLLVAIGITLITGCYFLRA